MGMHPSLDKRVRDINDSDVVYELKRNLGFCRDVWEVVADG